MTTVQGINNSIGTVIDQLIAIATRTFSRRKGVVTK